MPRPIEEIVWLGEGAPQTATLLFRQAGTGPGKPLSHLPKCNDLTLEEWGAISDGLGKIHNEINQKKNEVSATSRWVLHSQRTSDFRSNLLESSFDAGASIGVTAIPGANADASTSRELKNFSLIFSNMTRILELSPLADECVRRSVCAGNPNGGTYIGSAIYGQLIRLAIVNAKFEAAGKGGVQNYGSLSFELSTENMSMAGVVLGKIRSAAEYERSNARFDVPEMIELLKQRRLGELSNKFDERAASDEMIAVGTRVVKPTDCEAFKAAARLE